MFVKKTSSASKKCSSPTKKRFSFVNSLKICENLKIKIAKNFHCIFIFLFIFLTKKKNVAQFDFFFLINFCAIFRSNAIFSNEFCAENFDCKLAFSACISNRCQCMKGFLFAKGICKDENESPSIK